MRQRLKAYEFIRAEINAGREFPKRRAIADHMGWKNANSASDVLWALVKDGLLQADAFGRNPNFRLAERTC